MKFLPIVERELRVSARRWSTYWARIWVAMLVIAASSWIILATLDEPPPTVAKIVFFTVTSGALLYCLLVGVRATADCLSEEKREGTLGLLFLTDLKGYDVVAGKLVANSLNGFYGLLAILPVVTLVLLMGGLTATQVGCAAIALVNTMFLSVSVGMFASACCRVAQRAMSLTFVILLGLTLGVPAFGWWRAVETQASRMDMSYLLCSPVCSFAVAFDTMGGWKQDLQVFGWSVGVIHTLGWVFLLLAALIVPKSWQERPAGARRVRWSERWKLWRQGGAGEQADFRRGLLDENAFFWLAARDRRKATWVWLFLGLVVGFWVWGYTELKRDWFNPAVYIATAFLVNSVLKNWLASEAARQITEERRTGSLELLVVTPLSIPEILRGQALALRRQFLGPVLVVLGAEFVMLLAVPSDASSSDELQAWFAWWSACMITLVADLVALYWVGMWIGLSAKNPKRVLGDIVSRVLVLPWVLFLGFMVCLAILAARGGGDPGSDWQMLLVVWLALGLGTDFAFGFWARQKLLTEFRLAATLRYERRVPWWQRWLGLGGGSSK